MKLDVVSLADSVLGSASPDAAWAAFTGELAREGLERAFLHLDLPAAAPNPFAGPGGRTFGTFWDDDLDAELRAYEGDIRRAEARALLHIRPTLLFLSLYRTPFYIPHRTVLERGRDGPFAPICRIMLEDLGQHHALVLPLADPAGGRHSALTVWLGEPRPDFPRYVAERAAALQMAGLYLRALIDARWPATEETETVALSLRERQILAALAEGAQVAGIADRLAITERSVHEYIARARAKLGARSRTEAVVRALRQGQI